MTDRLDGINEKLKRADENICNLDREINAFFYENLYSIIPYQDDKSIQKAMKLFSSKPIPIRFRVLAGEIVHHLRSSLDHLAWQLSNGAKRDTRSKEIGFPVFYKSLSNKDEALRYKRKIDRATRRICSEAKSLIKSLQPCNGLKPLENPLFIIHEMDRIDKHRELVIVFPTVQYQLGRSAKKAFLEHKKTEWSRIPTELEQAMKVDTKLAPAICFKNFLGFEYFPVIEGLALLTRVVREVVSDFERFLT